MITYFSKHNLSDLGGFNLGGINGSGQVPTMPGNWGLVDLDTPKEAYTKTSLDDGSDLQLIFSDEFNVEGRTFYPGDDPYWEAVDLHYWAVRTLLSGNISSAYCHSHLQTNNMEWYDPASITTKDGALEITLSEKSTHGLDYQGGMMSTWNKFCFTGGMVETAVTLPGPSNVVGLWPAIWMMGNLGKLLTSCINITWLNWVSGRAGYGATLEGTVSAAI